MPVVAKVNWVGENGDTSYRPSVLNVAILQNSQTTTNGTITAIEGWQHTWNNLSPSWNTRYTVRVTDQLERYTATYEDRHEQTGGGGWYPSYTDTTTITMTFNPPPEPEKVNVNAEVVFYGDEYDALGMRPIYATVHLMRNGVLYDTVRIGNGWEWNWIWQNLDPQYTWTVEADDVEGYDKLITHEGNQWRVTYGFTYVPPVPPAPAPGNHPTKEDLDLMYSVLYDDISAENAQDVIHVLNYGTHIEGDG